MKSSTKAKLIGWPIGFGLVALVFSLLGSTGKIVLGLCFLSAAAVYNFWMWYRVRKRDQGEDE